MKVLPFKKESLETTISVVKEGDWIVLVNLADAYVHVPIDPLTFPEVHSKGSAPTIVLPPFWLEIERGSLCHFELSENVVGTLLQARKNSTNTFYHRVWKAFLQIAAARKLNPLSPRISNVLEK